MTISIAKNILVVDKIKSLLDLNEMECSEISNMCILLGSNAENNWEIYKESSKDNTIFHLDKFSSPYVIVDVPIDKLSKNQINIIARLCKIKSKYKSLSRLGVLYTSISNTILGDNVGSFHILSSRKKKVVYV